MTGKSSSIIIIKLGGVLIIVANYTGDRINFSIASERAKKHGLTIEMVVVGEDTALKSVNKAAGRRGLAGIVLIDKIAGAMSENKRNITEIKSFLNRILEPGIIGTIGISFSGCTPPGTTEVTFNLPPNMYELGLGVHGEAGVKKEKFVSMHECVKTMVTHLTATGVGHVTLKKGENIAVLVNNLGSCISLEMFSLADYVIKYLEDQFKVTVVRGYCGSYVTSLEMYGFSITILKIIEESITEYLDAPTDAPAWNKMVYKSSNKASNIPRKAIMDEKKVFEKQFKSDKSNKFTKEELNQLVKVVVAVCDALISKEHYLNELDREIGDSDCGSTFRRGAEALKRFVQDPTNVTLIQSSSSFLSHLSFIIETHMGGSSGGLLSLYFEAISSKLGDKNNWSELFLHATNVISDIGGAGEGDRTMLDVLYPVCKEWTKSMNKNFKDIFPKLAKLAQTSSNMTTNMVAKAGRASYVGECDKAKGPDPGAEAIAIILKAVASSF